MYRSATDEEEGAVVWLFQTEMTQDDWTRHFAEIEELKAWSRLIVPNRVAALLILDNVGQPGPVQRKALANTINSPSYDPYVAIVSTSALIRGVLTALRWLRPNPRYEESVHATAESAIDWLESKRESPLPNLRAMFTYIDWRPGRQLRR